MSTEVIEKTMATDLEPLVEFINDELLDIVEDGGMKAERYARLVTIIGNRIRFHSRNNVTDHTFTLKGVEYSVRVNNNFKGFVSVTNDDGVTGVSNTEFYPFFEDEDGWFTGLMSLAQMINEAWYLCNN